MGEQRRVGPPLLGVTEVEVDGRISVFSPATQELIGLNETAGDVWRLCDGEQDLRSIVALLASSYQVPAEAIARDVGNTIGEFVALGLLAAIDAP